MVQKFASLEKVLPSEARVSGLCLVLLDDPMR